MNKQQALEALLRECRGWESRGEEVRRVEAGVVGEELLVAARALDLVLAGEDSDSVKEEKVLELLKRLGGCVLYLLVDEVEVVTPTPDPTPGFLIGMDPASLETPLMMGIAYGYGAGVRRG